MAYSWSCLHTISHVLCLYFKLTTHSDPSEAHPLTQEEKDELDEADDEDHMHVPAVIVTAPSTPKVSALVMMLVSAYVVLELF